MAVVPVLTGNAFKNPGQFIEHLLYLAAMITIMGGLYVSKKTGSESIY
jgi:hypothetical protein